MFFLFLAYSSFAFAQVLPDMKVLSMAVEGGSG